MLRAEELLGCVRVPRVRGARVVVEGVSYVSRGAARSARYYAGHRGDLLGKARRRRKLADYRKGGKYFVSYAERKMRRAG